jgi:hypothetical protein
MTPLPDGLDPDAIVAGFELVFASGFIAWGAISVFALLRRLLGA